jgi:propanediol dehydratase large subunit
VEMPELRTGFREGVHILYDAAKCAAVTKAQANELIGVGCPLCGRRIAACPRTRRALESEDTVYAV